MRSFIFGLFWKKGNNLYIRRKNRILCVSSLYLGNNCRINRENLFDNGSKIMIGNNCRIGFRNLFITSSHKEEGIQEHKKKNNQIKIGNNVWITSNCTILPGTIIEDNVILSAGSVAKGKLESGWVYCGNPAVKVRRTKGLEKSQYF